MQGCSPESPGVTPRGREYPVFLGDSLTAGVASPCCHWAAPVVSKSLWGFSSLLLETNLQGRLAGPWPRASNEQLGGGGAELGTSPTECHASLSPGLVR